MESTRVKQRLCEEVFTDELISWLGNVNVEVGDQLKFKNLLL